YTLARGGPCPTPLAWLARCARSRRTSRVLLIGDQRAFAARIGAAPKFSCGGIDTRRYDAGRNPVRRAQAHDVPARTQLFDDCWWQRAFHFQHSWLGPVIAERTLRMQRIDARSLDGRLHVETEVDDVQQDE